MPCHYANICLNPRVSKKMRQLDPYCEANHYYDSNCSLHISSSIYIFYYILWDNYDFTIHFKLYDFTPPFKIELLFAPPSQLR